MLYRIRSILEHRWDRQLETTFKNWENIPEETKSSMVRMAQNYNRNTEAEQPALSLLPLEQPQQDERGNKFKKGRKDDIQILIRSEYGDIITPIIPQQ